MQVGEYELTLTDVTIFVFLLILMKKAVKWIFAAKIKKPAKYEIESAIEPRDLTMLEVQRLRSEENACLVVVGEKIYDLSGSRDLYENNRDVFDGVCGVEWEQICARKYPFVGKILKNH